MRTPTPIRACSERSPARLAIEEWQSIAHDRGRRTYRALPRSIVETTMGRTHRPLVSLRRDCTSGRILRGCAGHGVEEFLERAIALRVRFHQALLGFIVEFDLFLGALGFA